MGEDALVAAVVDRLRRYGGTATTAATVLVGPGDDAAVLAVAGPLVTSTDTLVQGVDFRLDFSDAGQVGRKAVVQVLADVEAMGARPVGLLVALVVPGRTPLAWCLALADGIGAEAERAGAVVLGGDVADGDALVVTGTSFGVLEGERPAVGRAGARPGDVVCLSGPVGASAAGLAALFAGCGSPGWTSGRAAADGAVQRVLAVHRAPVLDHGAGVRARAAGARALIDVSDGLVRDAVRLARASGVVVALDGAALPAGPDLLLVAEVLGLPEAAAREWVLTSGEEHAMLACLPPEVALPAGFVPVGRIEAGEPGVLVDRARRDDVGGWTHYGRHP